MTVPGSDRRVDGRIRAARPEDLPVLRDLEVRAGQLFTEVGLGFVAEMPPPRLEDLARHQGAGHLWVVEHPTDAARPVAYLVLAVVDGQAHVKQVSVDPDHARQGLGAALIEGAARWGRERGFAALTLTTYRDVPRNGPYYRRLGFEPVPEPAVTPGLRRIREFEASLGLDVQPRLVMRRPLR